MTTQTTQTIIHTITESAPTTDALQALGAKLAGELLLPGDEGYEAARKLHDFQYDRHPAAIVRAAGASDVAEVVRFARQHGLPLAVRSGGHSVAGYSAVNGAVMVDLSGMRGVSIDPARRTALVQAGATSADIAGPAHAYGLALTTGDTSTVGIGGLTLGGGIGWMVRKFGLTIDNLLSAQVVTADGELIRASADQHPDLFWALRGGGGNFGIVTEFEFRLAEVGAVYGGVLVMPATREVLRGYLDYTPHAPEELTTIAFLMGAPPAPFVPEETVGQLSLVICVTYVGDAAEGAKALAPLRALATPIAEAVDSIPYPMMYAFTELAAAPHGAEIRSMFTNDIPDAALDTILEHASRAPGVASMVQFRGLGGAMRRVPSDATAFGHRDKDYLVAVIGIWLDPADDPAPFRKWTKELWSELAPLRDGVYVNFVADEGEARKREAYTAAGYQRLAEVKRRYDPENMFRFNQNVAPAR